MASGYTWFSLNSFCLVIFVPMCDQDWKTSWLLNKFSLPAIRKCIKDSMENMHTDVWLQTSTNNNSQTKRIFLRHLYNGRYTVTTDMFEWSMSNIKVWLSVCFSFLANSLFLSALITSVSLLSKISISPEHLNIAGISYQQQVFPLFHNIRFSSHFFVTFERIRKF